MPLAVCSLLQNTYIIEFKNNSINSGDVLSRSFVAPWSFEQIHRFSM